MPSPLDLDQLRTFVAIVDTGSFTRAAEEVFKTQSAVSMQMRKLEERLGAALFERNGRSVKLTENGERLLGYARKLMRLSLETLTAFDDDPVAGHVSIGLPDDYAERLLPEILARFSRSNPRIELKIACETSSSLLEHVERGHLDVALICRSQAAHAEMVRREPLHFVTSAAHSVHQEEVVPLAIGRTDCSWRRRGIAALEAAGRDYRVLFTSWSATICSSAVLAGLAVTILPECALRSGMRVLTDADGFPRLADAEIGVVRGKNTSRPAVDALVAHIRDSLGNIATPPLVADHAAARLDPRASRPGPRPRPNLAAAGW